MTDTVFSFAANRTFFSWRLCRHILQSEIEPIFTAKVTDEVELCLTKHNKWYVIRFVCLFFLGGERGTSLSLTAPQWGTKDAEIKDVSVWKRRLQKFSF